MIGAGLAGGIGMGTILVRYAELGLKGRGARRRFESILVSNIMTALAVAGLEGLVATEHGRIFVQVAEEGRALTALARVFGVSSLSSVQVCGSGMEDMRQAVSSFSLPLLSEGQSFAVRARRTGDQPYTSVDMGRELGAAVLRANQTRSVRVDLTDPDVEIFVEARSNRAYIFSGQVPGPGGLPLGSQGRVLALLAEERDALAAWLIMKRGCRAIAVGEEGSPAVRTLRAWDPELKVLPPQEVGPALRRHRALAAVYGYTLAQFHRIKEVDPGMPAFFPLVGLQEKEIEERLAGLRA